MTATLEHTCKPMTNPRHHDTCGLCGKPMPDYADERYATRRRSLEFEREATRDAARGVMDPEQMIEHAEARARRLSGEYVTDWMQVRLSRDRVKDAREEATDARNHLVWWLEEHVGDDDEDDVQRKRMALTHFLAAYDLLGEGD